MKDEYQNKSNASTPFIKLWKNSWFILSALMNAISLINIGNDLKLVIFKWVRFFEVSFAFIGQITNLLLYPFIKIFQLIEVEIPVLVKHTFFFSFLFISTFYRAWNEKGLMYKSENYAPEVKSREYDYIAFPIAKFISTLIGGFITGAILASIAWLGILVIGNYSIIITNILLLIFFIVASNFGARKEPDLFFRKRMREYIFTVLLMVFLICLINYFYITANL